MAVRVKDIFDPSQPVRDAGTLLANRVIDAVTTTPTPDIVEVDFTGVRGIASSYYNIMLHRVGQFCGVGVLRDRLRVRIDSPAQLIVYKRSFDAVCKALDDEAARKRHAS